MGRSLVSLNCRPAFFGPLLFLWGFQKLGTLRIARREAGEGMVGGGPKAYAWVWVKVAAILGINETSHLKNRESL